MIKKNTPNFNLLFIDGLRAIAAFYVVINHAFMQYYDWDEKSLSGLNKLQRLSTVAFFQGPLAVDLFIVVSGFCLMLPVIKSDHHLKGGAIQFYKRRIVRIIPPYYLAILLSMILIWLFVGQKTGTHWDVSIPFTYKDVIAHVLLIHDFFFLHGGKINHSLWSVSVECRIYLFFPVLIYLWRKIGPLYTLFITLIVSFLMYLVLAYAQHFYPDINLFTRGVNPYIILFTLGMFAAECAFATGKFAVWRDKFPWGILLISSGIMYVIVWKVLARADIKADNFLYEMMDITFGLSCFFLLVICSKPVSVAKINFNWLRNALSWQPLVFLGSFAYSTYLIHAPIVQVLTQYVISPLHLTRYLSAVLLVILTVIAIIPVSYVFFIFCEKPFMRMGKKMGVKETEVAAVLNPAP